MPKIYSPYAEVVFREETGHDLENLKIGCWWQDDHSCTGRRLVEPTCGQILMGPPSAPSATPRLHHGSDGNLPAPV